MTWNVLSHTYNLTVSILGYTKTQISILMRTCMQSLSVCTLPSHSSFCAVKIKAISVSLQICLSFTYKLKSTDCITSAQEEGLFTWFFFFLSTSITKEPLQPN